MWGDTRGDTKGDTERGAGRLTPSAAGRMARTGSGDAVGKARAAGYSRAAARSAQPCGGDKAAGRRSGPPTGGRPTTGKGSRRGRRAARAHASKRHARPVEESVDSSLGNDCDSVKAIVLLREQFCLREQVRQRRKRLRADCWLGDEGGPAAGPTALARGRNTAAGAVYWSWFVIEGWRRLGVNG
jgi:hypothetical protein